MNAGPEPEPPTDAPPEHELPPVFSATPIEGVHQPADTSVPADRSLPEGSYKLPMPLWVKGFFLVVVCAFGLSLYRLPGALQAPVEYELAMRALAKGDWTSALPHLKTVKASYPDDDDVRIELAHAYLETGDFRACVDILNTFQGKELKQEQIAQLDQITNALQAADPSIHKEATGADSSTDRGDQ